MIQVIARTIITALSLTTVTTTLAPMAIAGPEIPTPPKPSPATSDDVVDRLANRLGAFDLKPGFSSVAVNYAGPEVTVYWKGTPPPQVAALLGPHPQGVTVRLKTSPYSEKQLDAAATKLLRREMSGPGPAAIRSIVLDDDGSGLTVELKRASAASRTAHAAESHYQQLTGVHVDSTIVSDSIVPLTRQNDSAPWQGGAALARRGGNNRCSTAFAIKLSNGQGRLLSAAHCYRKGARVRDGRGQLIGRVSHRARRHDAILINPFATPATIGQVYGGPWNARRSHRRYEFFAAGAARPAAQAKDYCTSGAMSGEHCKRRVTDARVRWRANNAIVSGFRASGRGVSVAEGDSGGPIYKRRNDGRVGARGLISGGSYRVPCQSTAEPTDCYRHVYGVYATKILRHWNARIEP